MNTTTLIAGYYDKVANKYDSLYTDGISKAENSIIKDWFTEMIEASGKKVNVLDLGCGTGLGLEFLGEYNEDLFEYTGLDISPEMICHAKNKFKHMKNTSFVVGDMTNLSQFEDSSFDFVTSFFGSFSHALKFLKAMSEINRVLKNNGKIFIMVYSRYSLHAIFDFICGRNKDSLKFKQEYNIRNNGPNISCKALFYSPCFMKKVLEKSNFKNVEHRGLNMLFEINLFKSLLNGKKESVANFLLRKEAKFLGKFPQFGHSLISIAEKR